MDKIGIIGACLGAGLAAIGAAQGIGKLTAASVESIARQPEMAGDDTAETSLSSGQCALPRRRRLHGTLLSSLFPGPGRSGDHAAAGPGGVGMGDTHVEYTAGTCNR